MKQSKDLTRFRSAVVYINYREYVVIEAEAGVVVESKLVFENENANTDEGLPPAFQGFFIIIPRDLLFERYAEIVAYPRREVDHRCLRREFEVVRYAMGSGIFAVEQFG